MISFPLEIAKALEELKIKSLTPIQEKVIPKIFEGVDLIALAETGSGKTLSFVLPLISQLIKTPKRPTRILIITPTKELSEQILSVVKRISRNTNVLSMAIYGGKSALDQAKSLKNGVHVLVACPGRLCDHIEKKTVDLSGVTCVVLDEADQLMDMGFHPQIQKIMEQTKSRKQTLLFSATMDDSIKLLVDEFIQNGITIEENSNSPKKNITDFFCPISRELRYPFLKFLIKHFNIKAGLIFTRTKDEARILQSLLEKDKYKVAALEGDMSTHERKKSLQKMRDKKIHLLIATDIAARGLDIPHMAYIINLNPPANLDSYIHRIGRAARHEKSGIAITLYLENEELDEVIILHEKQKKKLLPTKYPEFDYQMKILKKDQKIL